MQFNFRLTDLSEVTPWGGNPFTLHWFGLTDGWFWIDIGDQQLFRYSQSILDHWAQEPQPYTPIIPFNEYQVVRYWEDLLELLPSILDPLPKDLAAKVADADAWQMWQDRARAWHEQSETDASFDLCEVALRWWSSRYWSNGHLSVPIGIWIWSVGDQVHVRWDTRDVMIDGFLVWSAHKGEVQMPTREFITTVKSFDTRFIAEMANRVKEVKANWSRPEVLIDLNGLEREQDYRATLCDNALGRILREYEWDAVRDAMAMIDAKMENSNCE